MCACVCDRMGSHEFYFLSESLPLMCGRCKKAFIVTERAQVPELPRVCVSMCACMYECAFLFVCV